MTSYIQTAQTIQELYDLHNAAVVNGDNLIDTEYVEGTWIATFRNTPGDSLSFANEDFATIDEREGASQRITITTRDNPTLGHDLIDVEYGGGVYYSTYASAGSGQSDVSSSSSYESFTGEVRARGQTGDSLIDVEYADGQWIGTYNDAIATKYTFDPVSLNDLVAIADVEATEGFGLIDVEYVADGQWVGVFGNNGTSGQNLISTHNSSESLFAESANSAQYDIIDVSYGDGAWVGVYSPTIADTPTNTPSLQDQSGLSQAFNFALGLS